MQYGAARHRRKSDIPYTVWPSLRSRASFKWWVSNRTTGTTGPILTREGCCATGVLPAPAPVAGTPTMFCPSLISVARLSLTFTPKVQHNRRCAPQVRRSLRRVVSQCVTVPSGSNNDTSPCLSRTGTVTFRQFLFSAPEVPPGSAAESPPPVPAPLEWACRASPLPGNDGRSPTAWRELRCPAGRHRTRPARLAIGSGA